jgi:imidazolonepropionase-like amidohydrolase
MIAALLAVLLAQDETTVLRGLVLRDPARPPEEAVLLISGGRILKAGRDLEPPPGARTLDLPKGSWIVPGFIDAHSHLGSAWEADEPTEALTPHVKAVEGFETRHRDVLSALGSGVTLAAIAPGDGNVVGGRIGLVRLNGERYDRALDLDVVALKASLGVETLRRDRRPTSRTGAVALLRDFLRAQPPKLPVFVHASSEGEIRSAVDLARETGASIVLVHAREAAKAVDVLRAAAIPVAFGPLTVHDPAELLETPARLAKAGVPLALVSDAPRMSEDQLRIAALLAVKAGLAPAEALRALTEVPARLLGVGDRTGRLAEGFDADVAVWSGDPLFPASAVELVLVKGKITYRKGAP